MILRAHVYIVHDTTIEDLRPYREWISHQAGLPILVVASLCKVDFLVTLNTRHFISDPQVALRSGLRIGMPGDALAFVHTRLTSEGEAE